MEIPRIKYGILVISNHVNSFRLPKVAKDCPGLGWCFRYFLIHSLYFPAPDLWVYFPALDLWVYFPAPDLQIYFSAPDLWVYFPAPDLWVYFPAPDLQVYFPAPDLQVYFPAPDLWVYCLVLDLLETSLFPPINLLLSLNIHKCELSCLSHNKCLY